MLFSAPRLKARFFSGAAAFFLFAGLGAASDPSAAGLDADVEKLTGAHTRVVWQRDVVGERRVDGYGESFVLMGYDSRDGRGLRPILGETETWLKFVFRRWFIIADFIAKEGIDSFWTFDSDTLIFGSLGRRESRFRGHQATAQCRDCCLNGWIGSRALVEDYIRTMTALFRDTDFLDSQRKRLDEHAGLAFNEMDAFCEFRSRRDVRTFHAAQPLDGEFFDDALAYDANFEASPFKVAGRIQVKRLWSSPDGALYARHIDTGWFVRMITCNLSWLPDYVGEKLARFCLTPEEDAKVKPPVESELREVDLSQPLTDKIATALKVKVFELKRALGR